MRGAAPVASVVVPTRDRPAQLAWCLAALQAQTVSDFEIVVVDDASSDPGAVAAVVSAVPRSRLVVASGGGPAQARNLGAVSSRSSVLCFTDDDCRPDPGWLAALVGRIESGADAVAGHTRNGRPGSVLAAASQLVTNHLSLSSYDSTSGSVGFAPTCNIACRQEIHAAVPFDETFPLPAGEDRDWCSRLARHGYRLTFEPAAGVSHHQALSLRTYWRQHHRYGRGALHWRRRSPDAGLQPATFYKELLARGFASGPRIGALVVAAQAATAVGVAREAWVGRSGWRTAISDGDDDRLDPDVR